MIAYYIAGYRLAMPARIRRYSWSANMTARGYPEGARPEGPLALIRPCRRHGCDIMCKACLPQVYPSLSQEVSRQLSADKESSKKGWSERIGELGPAWITAIAALCAVFVGGGYAAGHASGSGTHDPAPEPTVTVTATATATVTSPVTPSTRSSHTLQMATSNSSTLGSYTVDLPSGYSIPLGASKPTQSQFDSSAQNGDLSDVYDSGTDTYQELGRDRMVQLQDGAAPTYQACTSSTAFTNGISGGTLGVAFCILEPGKIAGVRVVSQSSTTSDYILQVTVWRNIS
jgi:hypothetical protein